MKKINDINFEALLSKAIKENFKEEIDSVEDIEFNPSEEFKEKMNKLFKEYERGKYFRAFKFVLKRVALFLLISLGILSTLMVFSEDIRAGVKDVIVEWFEDHTTFQFEPKDEDIIREEFDLNRLPKEYKIEDYEDLGDLKIMFLVKENNRILFTYVGTDATHGMAMDNEHRGFRDIDINGQKAILAEGHSIENGSNIIWEMEGYRFEVSGEVEVEELINIVETIIKK